MEVVETYDFVVDRPPKSLSANSRAGWAAKHSAASRYQLEQGQDVLAQITAACKRIPSTPFRFARLTTTHLFRRQAADPDNCVAVLKPIIDLLQVANFRSGKRYRLGIISDDRDLAVVPPYRLKNIKIGAGRIRCKLEVW